MIPLLLLGGLLAAGAAIVAVTFWDQIKKYLQMALTKVKQVLSAAIVGVAAYVQSGDWREGIRAAYKFYSKDEKGMWQETVTTKTITADEVPERIRKMMERGHDEIDITDELKLEL
jgi:ABC-type proline/glycine betaine transport system permease subunit